VKTSFTSTAGELQSTLISSLHEKAYRTLQMHPIMQSFRTNDGITIKYIDTSPPAPTDLYVKEVLILVRIASMDSLSSVNVLLDPWFYWLIGGMEKEHSCIRKKLQGHRA
jgi:hypothetical protein